MTITRPVRRLLAFLLLSCAALGLGASSASLSCGPFLDVAPDAFCPFVLEIFYLGITTGTTPTTYDPGSSVNRLQMAAFLSRTVDGVVKRGSRRAALDRFWKAQNASVLGLTTIGPNPALLRSDGTDVWVANNGGGGTVSRVRAGDGKLLETWTGADSAFGVAVAAGRILVTGDTSPGKLYTIDPTQAAGAVTVVASTLPDFPVAITFDGARAWTANGSGSVSIVTPGTIPWTVTTVTTGFGSLFDVLFDGAFVWAGDFTANTLLKLDSAGAVLQTVTVGTGPEHAIFDGANIWVPNFSSSSVTVVRASNGAVLQTLTGNGLSLPITAAFDGERVLVTNFTDSISLWKAADLTSLGTFPMPASSTPRGACSDGTYFWIALNGAGRVARF